MTDIFDIKGDFLSLVASTRIRLARNIKGNKYQSLSDDEQKSIVEKIMHAFSRVPIVEEQMEVHKIRAGEFSEFYEHRLASKELCQAGGYLIISKDRRVSIMIGEEDNIRLQVIAMGFCPKQSLELAKRIMAIIEQEIEFDFDEKLGYLTSCPTNLGTGIRVSAMIHLPIMTQSGQIKNISDAISRVGMVIRGSQGEGSEPHGYFYQISNQITLGLTEEELVEKLTKVIMTIIENEKTLRSNIMNDLDFHDKIYRSLGTLLFARKIDAEESRRCLSNLLMGVQCGILNKITVEDIYSIWLRVQPNTISNEQISADTRDMIRAKFIRGKLKAMKGEL